MGSFDWRVLCVLNSLTRVVWKELLGTLAKGMICFDLDGVKFTIAYSSNTLFRGHELRDMNIIGWWHHFRNTCLVVIFDSHGRKLSDARVSILRDRLHSRNLILLERYGGHCWCLLETNSVFMTRRIVYRRHIHVWLWEISRHLCHAQLIVNTGLLIIQFVLGLQVHLLDICIIWERSRVHEVAPFVVI